MSTNETTAKTEPRHTYHLWELTDKTNSAEIYELARVAAELHAEAAPGGASIRSGTFDDDAKAMIYAIHRKLWEMPRKPDHSHPPYTHKIVNSTSVVEAAKQAFPGWQKLWDNKQFVNMATRAYRILAGNQLLIRFGEGGRSSFFLIRAWPEGYDPGYYDEPRYLSYKDEVDIAKQQAKAEELAGPVKVIHSLSAIPAPEPNAKSVMEYLDKLKVLIVNLQNENAALREQLEAKDDWGAVADAIKQEGLGV